MAMPQLVRQTAQLPLRSDGTARYAVVADTHSQPHAATERILRALAPDAILHAGDIGDLAVLEDLAAIAPVFAIRGNIDARGLPDVLVLEAGALRILMLHIGLAGPKLRGDAAKLARAARAQLVVCGHSHVPFIGEAPTSISRGEAPTSISRGEAPTSLSRGGSRSLTVFNPGSCGPRRFHLPIVLGTIDVAASGAVKLAHVDCETGGVWLPP
ncbi:MAG TPA: metallophosphoesterase family protein [Kofleriaceae bacterium]|nr:metallophosphoesterase family protein [Kofleriaceae bacterium]